jgi:transcriptional regulator with XRE-family HTH domain
MKKRVGDFKDTEIGQRIRALRLERSVSQTQLGKHLGVSFQQLQKYERGTNRVSAGRLQRIAEFFRVPITYFYDGTGEAPKAGTSDSGLSYLTNRGAVRLLRAYSSISTRGPKTALVVLAEYLSKKRVAR